MTDTQISYPRGASALIRNEPVQARSTARLAALLDAAAEVIDEIGYERLTTAMVAERAGASIGTVYRYFPDRIAVLQSLAARNLDRVGDAAVAAISTSTGSWRDGVNAVLDVLTTAFRNEAGFASLRVGDTIDLRPAEGDPKNGELADRLFDALVQKFSITADADARSAFQAAYEVADALTTRAFSRRRSGDPAMLEKSREAVFDLIGSRLG